MTVVLCDLDGIVTDFVHRVCDVYSKRHPAHPVTPGDLKDYNLIRTFHPSSEEWLEEWMGGCFPDLLPLPGAIAGLSKLSRYCKVYIVSAPMSSFPGTAGDKFAWCQKWLPFISPKNIFITHSKFLVKGDWLIDDSNHQLLGWQSCNRGGKTATITYPYNEDVKVDVRAGSWNDTE